MTEHNPPVSTGRTGDQPAAHRRRRRGRRRSTAHGHSASPSHSSPSASAQSQPAAPRPTDAETPKPRRSRRRRGRTDATGATATRRGREAASAAPSRKRRKATTRTHRNARRGYAETRMETRRETSAGGLVISGLSEAVNPDGSVDLRRIYVALIGRLDRRGRLLWSMPKGHVEGDEDIAATAEREVWEETGIHGEVFADLGVIDYWFVSDGTRIHKTVHHHLLRYVDGALNDEDPEVTEVAWIPASALIEHFAYADERKLARIAHNLLPDLARNEHATGRVTPR